MITYLHRACDKPVLSFNRDTPIQAGEPVRSRDWSLFDGKVWRQCTQKMPISCWFCQKPFGPGSHTLKVKP